MRIQLICSLFSLCGIIFFGGMETKEELLSLISVRGLWLFLLLVEVVCVFFDLYL